MDFKETNKKGFTLIELIIYVAIFSVIATGIVAYLSTMISTKLAIDTQNNLTMQGRSIIGTITKEIRDSYTFSLEENGTKIILDKNLAGTDQTEIYLSNGEIVIAREFGTPIVLSEDSVKVETLEFLNYTSIKSDTIVKIKLELQNPDSATDPSLKGNYKLSTSVNLRNGLQY